MWNLKFRQRATRDERRVTRTAFTLAEAMIAVVILSIAITGMLLPFTCGATIRAEGNRRTLGAKLASDLIEQVVNTDFDRIVSQYNYTEAAGEVKDASRQVFTDSNYARFSRIVSSAYVYVPQESGIEEARFIRVTVQVYYGDKPIAAINRLITK